MRHLETARDEAAAVHAQFRDHFAADADASNAFPVRQANGAAVKAAGSLLAALSPLLAQCVDSLAAAGKDLAAAPAEARKVRSRLEALEKLATGGSDAPLVLSAKRVVDATCDVLLTGPGKTNPVRCRWDLLRCCIIQCCGRLVGGARTCWHLSTSGSGRVLALMSAQVGAGECWGCCRVQALSWMIMLMLPSYSRRVLVCAIRVLLSLVQAVIVAAGAAVVAVAIAAYFASASAAGGAAAGAAP